MRITRVPTPEETDTAQLAQAAELAAGVPGQDVSGGGALAARVVALSAGVVASVARASGDWNQAAGAAAQAERLRARAAALGAANTAAFEHALATLALPDRLEPEARSVAIADALTRAAELPERIAAVAADVALLAAHAAEAAEPALRVDAAVAAALADGAARGAVQLVEVNLTTTAGDERLLRARALAATAGDAAARALASARAAS